MHAAFFAPYAILRPHFETELELIHQHLDDGDRVTVWTCLGGPSACDTNQSGEAYRCIRCRGRRTAGMALIEGDYHESEYERLNDRQRAAFNAWNPNPTTHEDLVKIRIENFDLGWAVLSSMVSLHRDPAIDLVRWSHERNGLMRYAWSVYYSIRNRIREENVDRLYVWNGRQAPLRAAMRAAQAEGVPCMLHERGHSHQHYELYRDVMPHDRDYITREIHDAWERAGETSDRKRVGADWFQRRANGSDKSEKAYISGQVRGQLPAAWDDSRRNVVVFPSSEDEFVAIGEMWRNPLFSSQLEGLEWLLTELERVKSDVHLTLRIHPNLADVDNEQTRGLARLQSPWLTKIAADDPACTYTLLHHSEKVLTFGSTIGIEAVYWRKASVLAGMSYYRDLGSTNNPESKESLLTALHTDLPIPDPEPALKYGYYQATFGQAFKYFQADSRSKGTFKKQAIRPSMTVQAHAQVVKQLQRFRKSA